MGIDELSLQPGIRQLLALGETAHQIQLERGCSALFLDSKGEIFADELREQYIITDKAIVSLKTPHGYKNEFQKTNFLKILQNLNDLKSLRGRAQAREIGFSQAMNAYTYEFLGPIIDLSIELALQIEGVDPVKVSAYSNFLQWKERAGRERAWGAHGFCSKVFRNREFSERMITLIEEQSAYKRAFMTLAGPGQKKKIEEILGGYVMECLENIHRQLADTDRAEELEDLSPVTWFELLTGKIERLKLAERSLVRHLNPARPVAPPAIRKPERPGQLEPHMAIIRALPAFSRLGEEELNGLLSHAGIRNYLKGKILFLQGETLSRFYLILSGWVKLFKGTDSGTETVLQMLSTGESLMEASVFLDIPSAVSAQVEQDTQILSIPAPIVRQSLLENKNFALNMIGGLSMRSQGLIRQIEHSRLKTATERVGWFLLKLGIEQSGGRAKAVTLPYDKATIASYLDMTPETFSRSLNQFRKKGFTIHNDQITKPDPTALCKFCDETLAQSCSFRDNEECPQTYLD